MTRLLALRSLSLALVLISAAGGLHAAELGPSPAPDTAPTAALGKAQTLVDVHCIKCHGSEVYTRSDRKVTSRDGLDRQVRRCETALELRWFDEDIAEVAGFLNQRYYHFK
jgi:cytochrome c553